MSGTVDRILKVIRGLGYDREGEAVASDTLTQALHDTKADSLDAIDVLMEIETEFGVELPDGLIASPLSEIVAEVDRQLAAKPARGTA